MSNEYESQQDALMEIRAAKSKLQKQLRALQEREWQLVDQIAERRKTKRGTNNPQSSEVSVERTMSQSDWISLKRATRSREDVWTDYHNLD